MKEKLAKTSELAAPSQMGLERGASWKSEYAKPTGEIHLRHYSPKTLQTYQGWARGLRLLPTERLQNYTQAMMSKIIYHLWR
jgi:hypothetical protein